MAGHGYVADVIGSRIVEGVREFHVELTDGSTEWRKPLSVEVAVEHRDSAGRLITRRELALD